MEKQTKTRWSPEQRKAISRRMKAHWRNKRIEDAQASQGNGHVLSETEPVAEPASDQFELSIYLPERALQEVLRTLPTSVRCQVRRLS